MHNINSSPIVNDIIKDFLKSNNVNIPEDNSNEPPAVKDCPISHLDVTNLELAIVLKNWKRFSQEYEIDDPKPLIHFKESTKSKIFMQYIQEELSHFTPTVIRRIFIDIVKNNLHKIKIKNLENDYIVTRLKNHISKKIDKKIICLEETRSDFLKEDYIIDVYIPDIPITHLIETRISYPPNESQLDDFSKCDIKMKKGHFDKHEDRIIKTNWIDFKNKYLKEVEENLINAFFEANTVPVTPRLSFVQFIAQGLPHRYLFAVYRRFICLYKPFQSGRYSLVDNLLYSSMLKRNIPLYSISKILNRPYTSAHKKKEDFLINEKGRIKKNDYNLKCSLINVLLHITECEDIYDLANYTITFKQWKILEVLFGIPYIKLKKTWIYTIKCFINKKDIDINYILKKFIKLLYHSKCEDYKTIDWSKLSSELDFNNRVYIWHRLLRLIHRHVPKIDWSNFKAVINHLYINRGLLKKTKYLKQLYLDNNGDLIIKRPKTL